MQEKTMTQQQILTTLEYMWKKKCANVYKAKAVGGQLLNNAAINAVRKKHKSKAHKAHMARI